MEMLPAFDLHADEWTPSWPIIAIVVVIRPVSGRRSKPYFSGRKMWAAYNAPTTTNNEMSFVQDLPVG